MKKQSLVQVAGTVMIAAALLLTGGCGLKNLPVPPESVVPTAITDLRYTIVDNGVKLTWSFPVKTIQGAAITDISSFELYLAEIPLADFCENCPIPFGKPVEVGGGVPFDGKIRRTVTYDFGALRYGHKYFFKVKSRASWLAASGDSNIVSFTWLEQAAAPQNLKAMAGDRQVSLSWQPVTTFADGKSLTGPASYQVMRSVGGADFEKIGSLTGEAKYVDRQVRNGVKYFYAVQTMFTHEGEQVAGKTSEKVTAIPLDQTAPLPPTGVTAVRTGVGIKIFWDKSEAEDLGGYLVYRRSANEDKYTRLGKVEPEYNLFVDREAGEEVRYYYAVTAIDTSTPPNESNKSREATVRY
jgi:fibronectin type 3 domain-containing protein